MPVPEGWGASVETYLTPGKPFNPSKIWLKGTFPPGFIGISHQDAVDGDLSSYF
jgi:hypothetical protein